MKSKFTKFVCFLLLLIMPLMIIGCQEEEPKKPVNPTPIVPTEEDFTDLSVREYVGENGVVAAANPYAAKAGLDILKAGGNAFDAAVAVSFALGVVEPNASGIGGGGIMVAYDATTGEYVQYNFREFVPGKGTAGAWSSNSATRDSELMYGPKAPGVPTQVAGLLKILNERGNLDRKTVMAPAIKYATDGVIVTPELAVTISDSQNIIKMSKSETVDVFTSDGMTWLEAGDTLIQKDYGKVLQEISDKGNDGFYKGWVADALVNATSGNGGLISHEDLAYAVENYPIESSPLQGSYKGYDILTASTPSSGGIILLEALNMLEIYGDVNSLGHNSADYINVVSTALQLAYGDKREYIADTKFADVPISGLINKQYAAERWQKFVAGKAYLGRFAGDTDYGNPWPYCTTELTPTAYKDNDDADEHYSTTTFSVADKDGNIVSVTQTINHFYGSGIVPVGCGFFLNDQLTSFSFTATSHNFIQPYKQPVSHIMPTIIMKDGDPYATLGSPGSLRIPSAVTEVVLNLIEFGMNIQDAIKAPRFYSYACSSSDASSTSKDLYVENAISQEVIDELRNMNYNVIRYGTGDINLFFGGVQGIKFIYEDAKIKLHGGADPRRDGKALGY